MWRWPAARWDRLAASQRLPLLAPAALDRAMHSLSMQALGGAPPIPTCCSSWANCIHRLPGCCLQGQFFQSLYQTKKKRLVGLSSEQLQVGCTEVVICA